MDLGKTEMERALELARSGRFATTAQIRRTIIREGYGDIPAGLRPVKSLREAIPVGTRSSRVPT